MESSQTTDGIIRSDGRFAAAAAAAESTSQRRTCDRHSVPYERRTAADPAQLRVARLQSSRELGPGGGGERSKLRRASRRAGSRREQSRFRGAEDPAAAVRRLLGCVIENAGDCRGILRPVANQPSSRRPQSAPGSLQN